MVAMTDTIDLNADLGEDESANGIARDIAIMDIVTSCNIASGGHAGSPETMRAMLVAAQARGVSVGAHPSYPDRVNFGRTSLVMDSGSLKTSIMEQMEAIEAIAKDIAAQITHMKPHGALYNDAQDDEVLAEMLVSIALTKKLALVGMGASIMGRMASEHGVRFITEGFIDRQYTEHSRLVPRSEKGAVICGEADRIQQGLALAKGEAIATAGGQLTVIHAETLCLHSDSDGALATAKEIRRALEQAGIEIAAPKR